MKLDEGGEQQGEGDEEAKRRGKVLLEKEIAKAKYPSKQDHEMKFACRVRLENFHRHENNDEGDTGLDALDRAVVEENERQRSGGQRQFQSRKPQAISARFHPEFCCQ